MVILHVLAVVLAHLCGSAGARSTLGECVAGGVVLATHVSAGVPSAVYMYMCLECKKVRRGPSFGVVDRCSECARRHETAPERQKK